MCKIRVARIVGNDRDEQYRYCMVHKAGRPDFISSDRLLEEQHRHPNCSLYAMKVDEGDE